MAWHLYAGRISGLFYDYSVRKSYTERREDLQSIKLTPMLLVSFYALLLQISPALSIRTFEHYKIKRIDYCVNFSLSELAPGCSSDQVMKLIRRGDVPPHFREWTEFDSTAHRMKSKPDSFYLICKSANINCYGKQVELRERNQKNPGSISQAILKEAQDIIRFEVQCKYPKVYALSRRAEKDGNDSINKYQDLLKYKTCLEVVNQHYEMADRKSVV